MSTRTLTLDEALYTAGEKVDLVADVAVSASGDSDSFGGFDGCGGLVILLRTRKVTGTTPTLDITVNHSDDAGVTWSPLRVFTQITAEGDVYLRIKQPPFDLIKLTYTVGGTAPVFVVSASVVPLPVDSQALILRDVTFDETAGAGTYTGTVAVPAGARLLDVLVETTAGWAAATAALTISDVAGGAASLLSALNVKAAQSKNIQGATGAFTNAYSSGKAGSRYAAADTITCALVTTGSGGTTGRTRVAFLIGRGLAQTKAAVKA